MNKKIGIIIGIIILLLLAGAAFMMFAPKSGITSNSSTQNSQTGNSTIAGTINSIFSSGKNQSCTFSDPSDPKGIKGIVFLSGKNMRGDFSTETTGTSHIIQNGDYLYIWSNGETKGMKMKMDLTQTANAAKTQSAMAGAETLNKKVQLECIPWTVDASFFTPPTGIEFSDMTSMINGVKNVTGTTGENPYKGYSCAGITDAAAKTACENAMNAQQ